jgi:hypothetical protein
MKGSRASQRRRRAIATAEQRTAVQTARPVKRRNRRSLLAGRTPAGSTARRREAWSFASRPGDMGEIFEQPFYSCRHLPGAELQLPLPAETPFACLIHTAAYISDDAFRELARSLLDGGMRYAIITGLESERLTDALDALLEEGEYHQDGRTALAAADDGETPEEAMEYFALPSGIAPANLLLTIGAEEDFQESLVLFDRVVKRMRTAFGG